MQSEEQARSWLSSRAGQRYLLCGGIYALLALLCVYLARQHDNIATLWFANAWLTVCLLLNPLRRWPGMLAAAAAGNLTANLVMGDALSQSASFLPANLLESLFAATLLNRVGQWQQFAHSPREMLRLLLLGGVLPAALGACLGASTIALHGFADFDMVWPRWFAGSAIGTCSILPLALLVSQDRNSIRTLFGTASLGLVLLTVLLDVIALRWLPYPFIYVTISITLAAALYGTAGAALPVLASALTCGTMIAFGYFVPPNQGTAWSILLIYIPLLLTVIPPLILGAITQQSRDHEQAMKLSENQFRSAFQTAANGIGLVSLSGKWLMVNRALCGIIGYDEEELLNTHFQALTHPDDLATEMACVQQLLDGKLNTYQIEKRYIHKNGHVVWVLLSRSIVRNDAGQPVHFVSQTQDISEAKRTANAMSELNDRLAREVALSEQRRNEIDAMFTLAPGALLVVDQDGRIVRANESAHEMFQYDKGTLHGELIEALIPEGERRNHIAKRTDFISDDSARPRFMSPNRDFAARRYDGSQFPAEVAIGPILVEGKRGAIAFVLDVSERRRHQTALEEAKSVAEAASRSKSEFVANMSHEIRTPMNAILGMVQLLQQTEMTYRQADYVDKTDSAARALLGILDDILDFSKIEAGKLVLDSHGFDVDKMMRSIGIILSANVGKKDIEILFDIDARIPRMLRGDALRLQQILINLGGNAIKFTERGEIVLAIRLLSQDNDVLTLHFSVRDTGIGIAPEHSSHIFEGFSQAEASTTRRFGGTGLGLAISQRLVSMMGGQLSLDSTLGVGSTFYFTLPLQLSDEPPPTDDRDSASLRDIRVLIVDDNASARDVIASIVLSLGWQPTLVNSGAEALRLLQDHPSVEPFEIIFIDWRMPDMDGWETSLRIRQMARNGVPPLIVMVTVQGKEMLAQRMAEEQALLDGFLVKPITASMLFDAVIDAKASHGKLPPPPRKKAISQQRLLGMHLLVVEDNLTNQQVARELLSNEGAQVAVASGGQAGIDAIRNAVFPFDGVLMDIQMPDMDGYAATRFIREELGLQKLPIIAMTANAMASDREACLAAGMNEHVGKPFDINQLVEVILRHAQLPEQAPVRPETSMESYAESVLLQASQGGLNVKVALDRFGGHLHIYRNALRNYLAEADMLTMQLDQHVTINQIDDVCRTLHSLKGLTATIGAEHLSSQIKQLEQHIRLAQSCDSHRDAIVQTQKALFQLQQTVEMLNVASSSTSSYLEPDSGLLQFDDLREHLTQLSMQLETTNLSAINHFADIQPSLNAQWPLECEQLAHSINRLDFKSALSVCEGLRERLAVQSS
ncbi:PAS domain S-box protein [Chitinimonas naiadis]